MTDLAEFRHEVQDWCRAHVPAGWRAAQTGVPEDEFVAFQKDWFQQLRAAGYAVPHWPAEWGGGMPVPQQVVLYQELAAHDAPEFVLDARAVKGGGKVVTELIGTVDPARGEAVIAYGWAMAEALADGLSSR